MHDVQAAICLDTNREMDNLKKEATKKKAQGNDEGDNDIVIPPIVGLGSTPSSYLIYDG